jgi:hypothetical protein
MIKVTNTHTGPRGVNAKGGQVVFLEPGETKDVDMEAHEIRSSKATGWFAFEGDSGNDQDEDDDAGHKLKHVGGGRYRILMNDAPVDETIYASKAEGEAALKALKSA